MKTPWGSCQGVVGGVGLPQGTDTPGVNKLPRGDETPGMTTAREGTPRADKRERGGDKKPPTTRATGAQGYGVGDNESMGRPRTAALPRPQRGTAADDSIAGTPPRHTAGTNGARPKHSALAHHECALLGPTVTEVNQADVGDPGSAAVHGVTGDQDQRDLEEGDKTLQRALPVRGTRDARDKGREPPPEQSRALNTSGHQGR